MSLFGLVKKFKFIIQFSPIFLLINCKQETEPRSVFREISGTIQATIPINQEDIFIGDAGSQTKTILLNQVQISNIFVQRQVQISEKLNQNLPDYHETIIPFSESLGAVDLGMNGVPVLDQGAHGTCVTFATTAMIDALLEQGDLISQQCILGLMKTFGKDYWFGAQHALQILKPLRENGFVDQNQCPERYGSGESSISASDYARLSNKNFNLTSLVGHFIEPITLDIVRTILNKKHRIALGFGLKNDRTNASVIGFGTQIKGQQTFGGLWACSQDKSVANYCGIPNAGHEVIIVGYDDQQKLLKVRNSWGNFIGDNGDFYMTYDFFEMMSFNGTEIY